MAAADLARRLARVSALAEPVRRELYLYVAAQPEPVSRDQAAEAVHVAHHTAKFHLDRLVRSGLLDVEYRRLTGRTGPGAGRPAKLYLRAAGEVTVSLPERRYDLAGRLMARAIDDAVNRGVAVDAALRDAAVSHGTALAHRAAEVSLARAPDPTPLDAAHAVLAEQGYEPRVVGEEIVLANCPFHELAADHPDLVCGMNLAILEALGESLTEGSLQARLDPGPGRCCVVLSAR